MRRLALTIATAIPAQVSTQVFRCRLEFATRAAPVTAAARDPRLHDEPAALLGAEIEFLYRCCFGFLVALGLHIAEHPCALTDQRRAPRAKLLGGVLLWLFGHVARGLQIAVPRCILRCDGSGFNAGNPA